MVQGRFVMASWARRLFQISDRNNNRKEWVILQITQLEYLQTNVLMFRWRTFIFDVKFRLDCTTIGPIDSFQFKHSIDGVYIEDGDRWRHYTYSLAKRTI
jgi:hypothetical protein